MKREAQLANVAFGGAWSEEIAGREMLHAAARLLVEAARENALVDLRHDREVEAALGALAAEHPKGKMLLATWAKALAISNPRTRQAELKRIAETLRTGSGL